MANNTVDTSELSAAFKRVQDDVPKVARAVVKAGGGVLVKQARANAKAFGLKKTGALIKNIVIKREPKAGAGIEQVNLGVRHGRDLTKKQKENTRLVVTAKGRIVKRYVDNPFYWHFLEFTTKRRVGTPYLTPTLDQQGDAAIEAMGAVMTKEIEKQGGSS
jgi:HK97 gp10 family phage protein